MSAWVDLRIYVIKCVVGRPAGALTEENQTDIQYRRRDMHVNAPHSMTDNYKQYRLQGWNGHQSAVSGFMYRSNSVYDLDWHPSATLPDLKQLCRSTNTIFQFPIPGINCMPWTNCIGLLLRWTRRNLDTAADRVWGELEVVRCRRLHKIEIQFSDVLKPIESVIKMTHLVSWTLSWHITPNETGSME